MIALTLCVFYFSMYVKEVLLLMTGSAIDEDGSEVVLSLLLSIYTMPRYLKKGSNSAEYSHTIFQQQQ